MSRKAVQQYTWINGDLTPMTDEQRAYLAQLNRNIALASDATEEARLEAAFRKAHPHLFEDKA